MGSPVPYSSLATVNVPQISLIAHLEFPDTYICVYIHVYTHAWSEIAFGGWKCLNVDNHSNDNVPNSAPMCIICIKRVPRQAFSSSGPLPPPFLVTPYMIQSAYNIRTREGGVTFMSIIRSRTSRQSDIAGFLYLTLFRSDFASFVREISSYIRFNLEQFLFRVG